MAGKAGAVSGSHPPDNESFTIERASPVALPVAEGEPLKDEMRAFIDSCLTGKPVPSNIDEALAVQRTLETMQAALLDMGKTKHLTPRQDRLNEHSLY